MGWRLIAMVVIAASGCGRLHFDPARDDGATGDGSAGDGGTPLDEGTLVSASNGEAGDRFGRNVAVSADGRFVAFGAWDEASNATGIDADQTDNSAPGTGAVYVFERTGSGWTQQAYIKQFNIDSGAHFSVSMALSADGSVLAVGADLEDTTAANSGAVYIYRSVNGAWTEESFIKASNAEATDHFGNALALSDDGGTLAVGAPDEDSAAVGVGGNEGDNTAASAGAVYVFTYAAGSWPQQAYIKASNPDAGDTFGTSLALSADGSVLAVGAPVEASAATGVNGNAADNTTNGAGAAYVFTRAGTTWTQDAYVKASNTNATDNFGTSVALSNDGSTLAVGAVFEQSAGRGIDADQLSNAADNSGAVYVFVKNTTWAQQTYIKSSNSDASDDFGGALALSDDGSILAVTANAEDSAATGINGDQLDNSADAAGAAYVFDRGGGVWTQRAYVKATDTAAGAHFAVRLAISGRGDVLAAGADFAQAQVGSGYVFY